MKQKAFEWAWKQKAGTPARKIVLMALADHADADGKAIVSTDQLRDDTGLSERGVEISLRHLERMGLTVREFRKAEDGRWIKNRYVLRL